MDPIERRILDSALVPPDALADAVREARARGTPVEEVLRGRGLLDEAATETLRAERRKSTGSTAARESPLPDDVVKAGQSKANHFGRYILVRQLGQGGMGLVYLAWQTDLRRYVAIKFIRGIESADDLARFQREAQTAAGLAHPNIAPVYEVGEHDGKHFYSMMYVRGVALDALLRTSPRPALEELVARLAEAARAVDFANAQGIVHRDIKPANLMVAEDGRVYVMDFGLARWQASGSSLTASGMAVGTPAYMSPEQAGGRVHAIDRRSDVYSLGATLYEIIARRPAFEGSSLDILLDVLEKDPPRPRRLQPSVPPDLETVCLKAMDKDPGRRYATAGDFAADVRRWIDGEPVLAKPAGALSVAVRRLRKHKVLASAVAAAALASFAGLALFAYAQYAKRRALESESQLERFRTDQAALDALRAQVQGVIARIERWDLYLYQPEFDITSKHPELVEAIRQIEEIRGRADLAEADYAIGLALRRLGRAGEAVERFSRAVHAAPNLSPAWYERGRARIDEVASGGLDVPARSLDDFRQRDKALREALGDALADFTEAIRLKGIRPDDLAIVRAYTAYWGRRFDDAVTICNEAIDAGSRLAEFFHIRGRVRIGRAIWSPTIALANQELALAEQDLTTAYERRRCEWETVYLLSEVAALGAWMEEDAGGDPTQWVRKALAATAKLRAILPASAKPAEREAWVLQYLADHHNRVGASLTPVLEQADRVLEELKAKSTDPATLHFARGCWASYRALAELADGLDPSAAVEHGLAEFATALQHRPGLAEARGNRAALLSLRMRVRHERGLPGVEQDYRQAVEDSTARIGSREEAYFACNNRGVIHDTWAQHLARMGRDPLPTLDLAIADFRCAIDTYPEYAEALTNLGNSLRSRAEARASRGGDPREDLEEAHAVLDRAIRIRPTADALRFRSMVRVDLAEHQGAAGADPSALIRGACEDLDRALEINPSHLDARLTRGNLSFQLGFAEFTARRDPGEWVDRALRDYEAVVSAAPRTAVAWRNIGSVRSMRADWLVRRGADPSADLDAAAAALRRALDLNPAELDARSDLAGVSTIRADWLIREDKDPTEALTDAVAEYGRVLEANPAHLSALNDRGIACNRLGRWRKQHGGDSRGAYASALADFDAVLRINPSAWRTLLARANAHENLGNDAKAADDLEAAARLARHLARELKPQIEELRRRASGQ